MSGTAPRRRIQAAADFGPPLPFWHVEDPHLVLVRLDIERGEYWDTDQNTLLKMFEIGKAFAAGRRPEVGDKGTLEPADAGTR